MIGQACLSLNWYGVPRVCVTTPMTAGGRERSLRVALTRSPRHLRHALLAHTTRSQSPVHRRRKAVRAHGGDDRPPAIEQIGAGTPAPAKDVLSVGIGFDRDQQRLQVRSLQNGVAQPSKRGDQFSRPIPATTAAS